MSDTRCSHGVYIPDCFICYPKPEAPKSKSRVGRPDNLIAPPPEPPPAEAPAWETVRTQDEAPTLSTQLIEDAGPEIMSRLQPAKAQAPGAREWECYYSPEENELKSGGNYGCTDGWEWVKVIEKSAYEALERERDGLITSTSRLMDSISAQHKLAVKAANELTQARAELAEAKTALGEVSAINLRLNQMMNAQDTKSAALVEALEEIGQNAPTESMKKWRAESLISIIVVDAQIAQKALAKFKETK